MVPAHLIFAYLIPAHPISASVVAVLLLFQFFRYFFVNNEKTDSIRVLFVISKFFFAKKIRFFNGNDHFYLKSSG